MLQLVHNCLFDVELVVHVTRVTLMYGFVNHVNSSNHCYDSYEYNDVPFLSGRKKPYMSAKLANCSNIS